MSLTKINKACIDTMLRAGFSIKEIAYVVEKSEWVVADYVGSVVLKDTSGGLDMSLQPCPTLSFVP